MITIAVTNQSTVVTDADVQLYCSCQQMQVTRDLYPIWGTYAKIVWVPKGTTAPAGAWNFQIVDDTTQAGALGYHDLATTDLPEAWIFAKTTIQAGESWSVCASHECCEMLVDPWINKASFDNVSKFYAYEVCDAVEDDSLSYAIGKFQFSDFVFPSWFEPTTTAAGTQFSFRKSITAPFTLAKGGYISYVDLTNPNAGWQQVTASLSDASVNLKANKYSRRLTKRKAMFDHNFKKMSIMERIFGKD